MSDQVSSESAEFTLVPPPPSVDTLLARLPDVVATNGVPTAELKSIVTELQRETAARFKDVRQRMVRVLEEKGVASAADLVIAVFAAESSTGTNNAPPLLIMPESCPEPVNGVELLDGLRDEFKRYLALGGQDDGCDEITGKIKTEKSG